MTDSFLRPPQDGQRSDLADPDKRSAAVSERIWCMNCGKSVSTPVPKDTIVRAWVECPECIEKSALRAALSAIDASVESVRVLTMKSWPSTHSNPPDVEEWRTVVACLVKNNSALREALAVPQSEPDWICSQPDCGLMHSEHKAAPKPAPACEAPAERKIKVPNLRAFDRSAKGDFSLFSERHCCVCGKEIKNTAEAEWILLTRAEDGAFEAAILHPSDATEGERKAGLWVAPIGADCLHKNAKLKPFLLGRELAASVPPPRSHKPQGGQLDS